MQRTVAPMTVKVVFDVIHGLGIWNGRGICLAFLHVREMAVPRPS